MVDKRDISSHLIVPLTLLTVGIVVPIQNTYCIKIKKKNPKFIYFSGVGRKTKKQQKLCLLEAHTLASESNNKESTVQNLSIKQSFLQFKTKEKIEILALPQVYQHTKSGRLSSIFPDYELHVETTRSLKPRVSLMTNVCEIIPNLR